MALKPTPSSNLNLPKSFTVFKEKLKTQNVLNSYQFQKYSIEFIHSINLEMCMKNLFFEVIHHQMKYERKGNFQIPVENVFQKEDIDLDNVYRNFVNQNDMLIKIDDYFSNLENIMLLNVPDPISYFWLVTFPNLFGSFLSLESSFDAKNFIKNLFKLILDETPNFDPSKKEIYLNHAILASISFVSHNYMFYDTLQKAFFCELTKSTIQTTVFENQFNSLKNALKTAALTFNQYQIQVLQIYFNSKNSMQNEKIPIQYSEFLDRVIFLMIDELEYSPYFQGYNFTQFKNELKSNIDKQNELMKSFEDVINQTYYSDNEDMVPFSELLFSHRISKVLTSLDIIILNCIVGKIENKIECIKNLMFFYQVIECSPESFSYDEDSKSIKDEDQTFTRTLNMKFSSNNIPEESLAQWLKLTERIKYGSDYDDIISYHAKALRRFNAYSESNNLKVNQMISNEIETLIKLGNIEHDQDIETKNRILKILKNFVSTIKINSNALDEILVYSSSAWILSLDGQKERLNEENISTSFVKVLEDFTKKYVEFDENDYNSNIECFDLPDVSNSAKFAFLDLLIADKKGSASKSNENVEKEGYLSKLSNNEYRNEKESSNNFYSFLRNLKKFHNDDLNDKIKRSIKYIYEIYIDYIRRGLFFADKKLETISVTLDDQFKKTYNQDLNNLLLKNGTKLVEKRRKFNTILDEMLPYLSCLLKPMIYDIEERENTVTVCLVSFENAASLINEMLSLIITPKLDKQLFSAFIARSALKFIKKTSSNEDETSETEQDPEQFYEKKLMTFYKLLANQNAYKNFPELQRLRTFFFH